MWLIVIAVVGGLIGAMLNALADDLPNRRAPQQPHCHQCGRQRAPWQWVAMPAFIILRTSCPHCGTGLKFRSLAVEVVSAALLVYLFGRFGFSLRFGLMALLLEGLLLITIIDLEHRLILYVTIVPIGFIALLYGLLGAERGFVRTLIGGAAGFAVVYAVYLLGWAFGHIVARVRGEAITEVPFGGGDVNLAGVIGLAVGWQGILLALFIAVMSGGIGALIYLIVMLVRGRYSLFSAIPYGPFLVLGGVILLLFDSEIKQWYGATP